MDEYDPREYTFTLKGKPVDMSWSGQAEFIELEDMTDYILEEDRENLNKFIEKLQKRIHQLNCENARLRGQAETWEKAWRIFNEKEGD